jgi:hypothetical protein
MIKSRNALGLSYSSRNWAASSEVPIQAVHALTAPRKKGAGMTELHTPPPPKRGQGCMNV